MKQDDETKPDAGARPAPKSKDPGASHNDYLLSVSFDDVIEALDLVPSAKNAAVKLKQAHPHVVFTSGRRSVHQQASAMAGNVVRNRGWIGQTYLPTDESRSLQQWVDAHPDARTREALSEGLEGIMKAWSDVQKCRLSRHFGGQAFDIHPVAGQAGAAMKKTIRALPKLRKFLEREGGLIIWHADFE